MFITDANLFWVLSLSRELDLRALYPAGTESLGPALCSHGRKYTVLPTFPKSLVQSDSLKPSHPQQLL